MKNILCIAFFIFSAIISAAGQELFPLYQPASTLAKNTAAISGIYDHYSENGRARNSYGIKGIYGLTAKLTVEADAHFSNHHDTLLPVNLISHRHTGNQTIYFTNQKRFGMPYPTRFNGFHFYAKYRIFSNDGFHKHLRIAVFSEYSTTLTAHDEAEPDLEGDNAGFGGGLIITCLHHKFAASVTSGIIIPKSYHETRYDFLYSSPEFKTSITYGNAFYSNLSLGYLLYPSQYTDYSNLNINLYAEFEAKWYEGASLVQNNITVEAQTATLRDGNFIDIHPGIQFIFNSNLRVECSVGLPLYKRSYTHFYPEYKLGIMRFLYF